jgi:hypothetical protein
MEVKGKSESALFRHLGEEFSDLKNKSRSFLREHLNTPHGHMRPHRMRQGSILIGSDVF